VSQLTYSGKNLEAEGFGVDCALTINLKQSVGRIQKGAGTPHGRLDLSVGNDESSHKAK